MTKVDFFNINTGETIWLDRPAQLKAAIESSDLGVNRKSDRGWRIGQQWKNKLRQARNDRQFMDALSVKYNGEVTEAQLLVAVFVREARAAKQAKNYSDEAFFEQQYRDSIAPKQPEPTVHAPEPEQQPVDMGPEAVKPGVVSEAEAEKPRPVADPPKGSGTTYTPNPAIAKDKSKPKSKSKS